MLAPAGSQPELSDYISLRIIVPRHCVRLILAHNGALISAIRPFLPDPDASLVFNGTLLNDEHTLAFYHLQSNDSLVAIPQSSATDMATRWMTITKDVDSFTDSVNVVMNPDLRRESLRLRDCIGWRAEMRRHFFRRIESQGRTRAPQEPALPAQATVIPKRALELSSDPLPVFWDHFTAVS
jgi:hypothetical protein